MYNLVYEKRNDIFTDSWVIAQQTGNAHESVCRTIRKHSDKFKKLGELTYDLKSRDNSMHSVEIVLLNEPQASFLITLLRNTDKVLEFKLALVSEFYRMRQALMERRTTDWLQTREHGKLIRRNETDMIQKLTQLSQLENRC